jgi:N-acetylneuraminate synthase
MSVAVVATAVSLGACVIEKHLTLDRREGGPDASFSLEPDEFAEMVKIANECFEALGEGQFGPRSVEDASVWERPSVWATRDIKKGEIFTTGNIRVVRPSGGLHPRHYDELLGKRAATSISAETALQKTTLCIGL